MSTTKNAYTAEAPAASAPETNDPNSAENSNAVKDPATWTTGDDEMTGAQKSYLKTLFNQAGEAVDETLTKAAASQKIDKLQQKNGRGTD